MIYASEECLWKVLGMYQRNDRLLTCLDVITVAKIIQRRYKMQMNQMTVVSFDCRSIDVFEAPDLQHVCKIQVQKKLLSCLKWHPLMDKYSPSPLSYWLASSSRDPTIHIFNLQKILGTLHVSLVLHTVYYNWKVI